MDESYSTWIAKLMNGTAGAGEQAARERFRREVAPRLATPARPVRVAHSVETAGPNTWAWSTEGDVLHGDGLAVATLLDGPGIPGIVGAR